MNGMLVFTSLTAALHAGYELYDEYVEEGVHVGYIVRIKTRGRWARALVDLRPLKAGLIISTESLHARHPVCLR